MKKKKYSAWQGFVHALSLPEDAFVSQTHVELFGQKELVVSGARGILEYSEELVRIQTKERGIAVEGNELRVDMFMEKVMIVRGKIHAVLFE